MIAWGRPEQGNLRPEEIDAIVQHIRSWEPPGPDLASVATARGDPQAGRSLYRFHCASCHGPSGEGGIGPALASPTFLAVASDEFLAESIVRGRPNTAMPAFRQLSGQHVSDVLAYLRSLSPLRSDRRAVLALTASRAGSPSASAAIGRTLYTAHCVTCHGERGQGDLGPSIASPELLAVVGDGYLYDAVTEGRPGTGMPAFRHLSTDDVASLIVYVRGWQSGPDRRLPPAPRGDPDAGLALYKGSCSGCHGRDAEGGVGPQLHNPALLMSATDAMLFHWIAEGRTGTAMRPFLRGRQGPVDLSEAQIADLVAYIRSLERVPRKAIARAPTGRPELGRVWFAGACAGCHGENGEGSSGPSLANPAFLRAASDGFLMATMALGRDGTPMRPVKKGEQSILSLSSDQVNDVVAYLRSWESSPPTTGIPHRFVVPWDHARGRRLYEANCAGCHGASGRPEAAGSGAAGPWAPALANDGFLAAATDGFLQATIARGRMGTAMRPFGLGGQGLGELAPDEIDDIVAYIRSLVRTPGAPTTIPAKRGSERRTEHGE
jgi:mono/diheme cytochrome c family protein